MVARNSSFDQSKMASKIGKAKALLFRRNFSAILAIIDPTRRMAYVFQVQKFS
jgi:hypothetical protein